MAGTPVTVIGMGPTGRAPAAALVNDPTTIWNRTPGKAYDVGLLGIRWSTFNGFMHAAAPMDSEKIAARAVSA
ncbi:hypothetical protein [Nonomuraea jiangxiensis]|uniref:NADPH-dependent reductive aminase-like C-terminal domain-containing protein n=1 Tax=Nonomuraea jiangxiensis TaxID=633440 RepID=A0A1G8ZYW9_9ACTN|nr:hypothetical protein [Nonomuraea jiangxiensis]SDK20283.1 hypothetical protein SAMN05421869_114223 [Nonomuraea jiangxiensis]